MVKFESFDTIKGQDHAKKILRQQIEAGHVGHAYLFVGIDGIGKRMMAKAFAQEILYPNQDFIGRQKIITDNHPDVRHIKDKPQSIGVEIVRKLKKDTLIPPYECEYKVFIIDHAHQLTIQAQNAFLKMLEEPVNHVVFILIVEDLSTLLPTVISRCEMIRFTPLSQQCMIEILSQDNYIGERAVLACALNQGSVGQALQFCKDVDWQWMQEILQRILSGIIKKDRYALLNLAVKLAKDSASLGDVLNYLAFIYHNGLRKKIGCHVDLAIPVAQELYEQMSIVQLFKGSQAILDSFKMLNRYQNKQLVLETLLLKLQEG